MLASVIKKSPFDAHPPHAFRVNTPVAVLKPVAVSTPPSVLTRRRFKTGRGVLTRRRFNTPCVC